MTLTVSELTRKIRQSHGCNYCHGHGVVINGRRIVCCPRCLGPKGRP